MGQKVNPHGLRVGITKDWDSQWYEGSDFTYCDEDLKNSTLKIGKIKDWNSLLAKKIKKRLILPRRRLVRSC